MRAVLLVVAAAIGGLLLLAFLGALPSKRQSAWSVRYEGAVLYVKSGETNTFQGCDLELNDRYKLTGQSILYFQENSYRMAEFADQSGARFNIRTTKPVNIYIRCRWPEELSDAFQFR